MAEQLGLFLGSVLAAVIKHAGPQLREFLVGCIREALNDKVEVGSTSGPLDNAWDNGLLQSNASGDPKRGDGDSSGRK